MSHAKGHQKSGVLVSPNLALSSTPLPLTIVVLLKSSCSDVKMIGDLGESTWTVPSLSVSLLTEYIRLDEFVANRDGQLACA